MARRALLLAALCCGAGCGSDECPARPPSCTDPPAVWLASPRQGAVFRPGEDVTLAFRRRSGQRVRVAVAFDGRALGDFAFPAGNRTLALVLGAAPAGRHVVRAEANDRLVAELTLHVADGELVLHAGAPPRRAAAPAGRVQLDPWGCLLLGAWVSSLPGVSASRPLHLWLNGERLRTDEGWLVARVPPGRLHVRGAVTDDWGDVALENETVLHVELPAAGLMGESRSGAEGHRAETLAFYRRLALARQPLPHPRPHSARAAGAAARSRRRPAISCLHPTRGRPEEALATRARWLAASAAAHGDADSAWSIEWVFAVDSDDPESRAVLLEQLGGEEHVVLVSVARTASFHPEPTCVAAWNAAALAAGGRVLMAVADDFYPPPRWDEGVLGRLAGWRAGALMIPDGISSCRVAVPSPRDLLPSIPYHLAWERRQQDRGTTQEDRGTTQEDRGTTQEDRGTTQDDWGTTPDGQPAQASAHAYGVLQSHPVVNRLRYLSVGFLLYPEYASVYCDDDFTLAARMDRVEEDGMQLAFEHRHSMHAAHPSSSLSLEPDQEKSVSSGEARADHDDTAVGDRAQEQGRGRGKMHATTARNNAFLRYLHGARLFQRRSNGRGRESQHILRVTSQMSAGDAAGQAAPQCASGNQAPPDPWLMSNGLGAPPAAQGDARSYAGGGVLLSILALVHLDEEPCQCADGCDHTVRDESKTTLLRSHPHLEALVELVRHWHADHSVRASLGAQATEKPNHISIEFLVAAAFCERSKATCLTSDQGCQDWEDEHDKCAGFQHRVRNSLLDVSSGRFVVWAVPSEMQEVGAETWLASILSSRHLYPTLAQQQNGSIVAEEWDMSVFEAAAILYDSREDSAGVRNACSWQSVGPLLRPLALFVRFRNVLPADDAGDGLVSQDTLWSVRLAHVWHLIKLWPPKHSMHEMEEQILGRLTEADHLQRFCTIIAAASSDVVYMASTDEEDSEIGKTDQDSRESVAKGWTQLSQLLWVNPAPQAEPFTGHMGAEGSREEDDDVRGIWATPEEHARTREVLISALSARSIDQHAEGPEARPPGIRPKIAIHEPQDGGDLIFDTFEDKAWTVRATIDGFDMGVHVGYACVFLDGLYKGCSVDGDLMLVFDDPGLDFSWHLLEVRLVDGQDQQVAPSAVAEFRAGVRPCSPPLTEHIISLIAQGLVWHLSPSVTGEEPQEREGTSSRITCVSSLSQALHPSVHHTLSTQPHSLVAHQTLWADEESFAAVMAFANYRRWWREGAMASRNISVSHAKQQPLLLHNATIYYPGLVLAPSLSMAIKPESDAAQSVARVLYNLRGPCDDRNLYAVVPSGPGRLGGEITGAIVVQQIWGDAFYHWMIECLPRLAAVPAHALHNPSIALLVPALHEFICESLSLLGIERSRLRVLNHATYYMASQVWLPPPGVCGLGPATMLLRNMNSMLRSDVVGEEAPALCLVVQRKHGGGREVANLDELLRALYLLPSSCAGRWQVVSPVDEAGSMLHVARLFARALVVVAPHGGTLANLLFSRASGVEPGTHVGRARRGTEARVLELLPANRPNLCYERLCRSLGLRYMGLVVPDTTYNQPMHVHVPRVLVAFQALLSS